MYYIFPSTIAAIRSITLTFLLQSFDGRLTRFGENLFMDNSVQTIREAESESTVFFAFLMLFTSASIAFIAYGLPFIASLLR